MKKIAVSLFVLVTVFAKITQGQEIINGDKTYTGDNRFNKGIYFGASATTLPLALPSAYTKFAIIYDPLTNTNLTTNSAQMAFGITDMGAYTAMSNESFVSEPRQMFLKSRGTLYSPTNVQFGDMTGRILFNNYYNGTYRRGANIYSTLVSTPSNFIPASSLTFAVRTIGNSTNETDNIMELSADGSVKLFPTPPTSTNGFSILTRNTTTKSIELLSPNTLSFTSTGFVGINTATPREQLSVNGKIRAKEIKLELINWPDFVFEEKYQTTSLNDLEQYIKLNKHLPGIPSAAEVALDGIDIGELNKNLLQKIEELTLHLIEQNKKIEAQTVVINKILSK